MEPGQGQHRPDRDPQQPGGGLGGAFVPPVPDSAAHMSERLAELYLRIRAVMEDRREIALSRNLSIEDLLMAGLNGLSPEFPFSLPASPKLVRESDNEHIVQAYRSGTIPGDQLAVTASNDSTTFQHVIWCLSSNSEFPQAHIDDVRTLGVTVINPKVFDHYLEILQEGARFLRRESAAVASDFAELAAILAVRYISKGHPPSAALPPFISIESPHKDGLSLTVFTRDFVQRMAPGSTVFVAGAGYNALRNLSAMAEASTYRFILNDRDPLVAKVLEHAVGLYGAKNITVLEADMIVALKRCADVDTILISNIPTVTEAEIRRFLGIAGLKLSGGSAIHVCQVVDPAAAGSVQASAWYEAAVSNGFQPVVDLVSQGFSAKYSIAERAAWIERPGVEVHSQLKELLNLHAPRAFRYFVSRADPSRWSGN